MLAAKTALFTLPDLGGDPVSAADKFVESLAVPVLSDTAAVADHVSEVGQAVQTILDVAAAYEQCDP